jgi:hypothetical protein
MCFKFLVDLEITTEVEYFIEAHESNEEGEFDPVLAPIGHYEDTKFPQCNSYACCDPRDRSIPVRFMLSAFQEFRLISGINFRLISLRMSQESVGMQKVLAIRLAAL